MDWIKDFPAGITVCDTDGIIIQINARAEAALGDGKRSLLGSSIFDCHRPESVSLIRKMLADGVPHSYTIEKAGQKKLIHQQAWYQDGQIAGLVEISFVLPADLPHYTRG